MRYFSTGCTDCQQLPNTKGGYKARVTKIWTVGSSCVCKVGWVAAVFIVIAPDATATTCHISNFPDPWGAHEPYMENALHQCYTIHPAHAQGCSASWIQNVGSCRLLHSAGNLAMRGTAAAMALELQQLMLPNFSPLCRMMQPHALDQNWGPPAPHSPGPHGQKNWRPPV